MTGTHAAPQHAPLVEVTRGDLVESVHHGSLVALDASGAVVLEVGDVDAPIYARSSLKPLQTTAMVRAGLDLPPHLLALASASHSGAAMHQEGALAILAAHGLDEEALRNVDDLPIGVAEREAWLRADRGRTRLAQNCSGKHAAMLATCVVHGWDLEGYLDPEHPLQQAVVAAVEDVGGEPIATLTADGCGTPLPAISVRALATAFGRLASAPADSPEGRVAGAMRAHPEMVGGEGRDVTAIMRAVPGLMAKDGAEAVYGVGLADGRSVALKVADGGDRARVPALLEALARLGVEVGDGVDVPPVLGGGRPVGGLRAVFPLPAG